MENEPEKPLSTSAILGLTKTALATQNTKRLGELLALLCETEPLRWITLLHLDGIFPDPNNKTFSETLKTLAEAMLSSLQIDTFDPKNAYDLLLPLVTLKTCFSSITKKLEEVGGWEEVGARTIYRVATFLEDQFHLMNDQIDSAVRDRGFFESDLVLDDNMPTMLGGVNSNKLAAYEENCENLQLILAYSLYKYKSRFFGDITHCRTPYDDIEFTKLLALASIWRRYQFLWSNIVYLGWHPITTPEFKGLQVYIPRDEKEFLRSETAYIRSQQALNESISATFPLIHPDQVGLIERVASSIQLPLPGEIWNGYIDINTLKEIIYREIQGSWARTELVRSHYNTLISEIKVGKPPSVVGWDTYQNSLAVLRVLAQVFRVAVKKIVASLEASAALSKILVVTKVRLVEIVSEVTNLDVKEIATAIEVLIFDPKHNQIEIWDTPLVEIGADRILFIPALVEHGSLTRAIENITSQWNSDLFKKRGKLLENAILEFLRSRGIKAKGPVIFKTDLGEEIECDLVAFWDGYLILIESKCTKEIFNAADLYRARKHIEDAIEQLNHRRESTIKNWDAFREAANLDLPKLLPDLNRIKMIAITNVLDFTGYKRENVVVIDELCLHRFFGTPDINVNMFSKKGVEVVGSIGRVRKSERITANEFFEYLEDPIQVRMARESIRTELVSLPLVEVSDPSVAMIQAVYTAERHNAEVAAEKFSIKSKHKRRHKYKKR